MNVEDWLIQQQQIYQNLPDAYPEISIHPVSGEWQTSAYLKSQFWWGGGASIEACRQVAAASNPELTHLGVLSFGPVQEFLGGGERLRDWAVASWLCHYLTAVAIYRWEERQGRVLLPLHRSSPLLNWLRDEPCDRDRFWQAELPNVITGLHPQDETWLQDFNPIITQEWGKFLEALEEEVSQRYSPHLLNGQGWQVIHRDNAYLWSVYTESTPLSLATVSQDIKQLRERIESRKIGRQWQATWWGGRTSPSAGHLSIWHPGLKPIHDGGTWGLPDSQLKEWWLRAANESRDRLSGLVDSDDRLNSIEFVRRLASVPDIIEPTLQLLWGKTPPPCPWGQFPDRATVAAAWVVDRIDAETWNDTLDTLYQCCLDEKPNFRWGMPKVDGKNPPHFAYPRILERRYLKERVPQEKKDTDDEKKIIKDWEDLSQGWESPIEWTVGWRGDGDNMGKWLSGKQYETLKLQWSRWHPNQDAILQHRLYIDPPTLSANATRQLDLPHVLDLSVLFGCWNQLLYPLAERHHNAKVIFAGGDDFLLLGPLTEAVSLTSNLYRLWRGQLSPLTQPLDPPVDGWVQRESEIYPVPGQRMDFSLGVAIAQRRIPQSLWHRGLTEAYKEAKNQGRDRVCIKVLFNSGQSLDWVCPWRLWELLMHVGLTTEEKTELNRWEKLLSYLESNRLQQSDVDTVRDLIETLWASVGIALTWEAIETVAEYDEFDDELGNWSWWIGWISVMGFLARQEREREKWVERVGGNNP
jgi:CRISPR-associated protein Cmr2